MNPLSSHTRIETGVIAAPSRSGVPGLSFEGPRSHDVWTVLHYTYVLYHYVLHVKIVQSSCGDATFTLACSSCSRKGVWWQDCWSLNLAPKLATFTIRAIKASTPLMHTSLQERSNQFNDRLVFRQDNNDVTRTLKTRTRTHA